jgi:regulator of RNase E activity RraA
MGGVVKIGGMQIKSGELLHGDVHGVQSIPIGIAARVPAAAAEIVRREEEIIALCQSAEFSLEKLRKIVSKNPA